MNEYFEQTKPKSLWDIQIGANTALKIFMVENLQRTELKNFVEHKIYNERSSKIFQGIENLKKKRTKLKTEH